MHVIMDKIKKEPGIHLIYSDFKTLSGCGIMALVLEAHVYKYDGSKTKPSKKR